MTEREKFEAWADQNGFSLSSYPHAQGDVYVSTDTLISWIAWKAAKAESEAELAAMSERKDGAYLERNRCVALIAQMAIALGLKAGKARTAIEGWSDDWHGCVYIDLPAGQVSWHYHDSQAFLFDDLPAYECKWDGHDTDEKYRRVGVPFESALGRELEDARKDAERKLRAAVEWALGTNGDFRPQGTMEGKYWWRGELAERAGLRWDGEKWIDAATSYEG